MLSENETSKVASAAPSAAAGDDATMKRRTFLKGAGALGALALAGGAGATANTMFGKGLPQAFAAGEEQIIWTHCAVNCGSCCAFRCHVQDGELKYVETDNTESDAFGDVQIRACLRGRSIRRWLGNPDRLSYPLRRKAGTKRGDGEFEQITWEEALDTIASEMKRIRETYGNEAMTVHYSSGVDSGQFQSTPVSRLMNLTGGYLNYYGTYSSAHIAAAGTYTYGGGTYGSSLLTLQDEDQLVVMFGNSPADTRMGGAGHTYDFAVMREKTNAKVIIIDYRMNSSLSNQGGEWIPIRPGTDGALVAGLAHVLISENLVDIDFLHKYCVGYDEETLPQGAPANSSYKAYILGEGADKTAKTPAWAAEITQIPEQRIIDLAHEMAAAKHCYISQGYGCQRHSNGEIAARAIMVLPQLLGAIGKPGTNDGRREGNSGVKLAMFPTGTNPVKTKLPTFEWPNAIKDGKSLTALNAGVQDAERLSSSIKFIFNYAGNCLTNQHSDINGTHDLLQDESLCEFIVTSEVFMTDSAKHSDIILPDLTSQEQISVSKDGYADNAEAVIYGQPLYEPKFERRGIYEVCCDLAERLGVYDAYSDGGKTREDWMKKLYEDFMAVDPLAPSYEEGLKMGVYKRQPKPIIALEKFIADPDANPLPTESGKIQIYSEKLADFANTWELADDEVISAIPEFDPGFESYVNLTDEYPLIIAGYHTRAHTHSSYTNNPILQAANAHQAWVNPVDAEARGIKDGDTIRVFNKQGEIRILAKVTPLVIPGAVAIPQGKWHDADMDGDRIDHGGCINTLTIYRPSPLAKGNPQHSNIGQIAKA